MLAALAIVAVLGRMIAGVANALNDRAAAR
jgi:hypothetical protein